MNNISITYIDLLPSAEVDAGEVFCGSLDSPVSMEGMKGLKKAVRRKSGWDVVASSPKVRCVRFAAWVAEKHELPLQEWKDFREMDFGTWEGEPPHIILQQNPEDLTRWWSDPASASPPAGESFAAFRKRVLKGWSHLLRKHKGQQILLITHPGVLRVLLSDVLGLSSEQFFNLHIEHGAMSRIRVAHDKGGDWSCLLAHGCS